MVQTRQQIETLIQRNIHNLIRFDINRGENIVSFRLSNIINHINILRVDRILNAINRYNSYNDIEFPEEYIARLRDLDDKVISLIRDAERINTQNKYIRNITINRVRSRATLLYEQLTDINTKICADYDLYDYDMREDMSITTINEIFDLFSKQDTHRLLKYKSLRSFISFEIQEQLIDKDYNFTWNPVGEIVELRSNDRDEEGYCVTFANISIDNIVIDI